MLMKLQVSVNPASCDFDILWRWDEGPAQTNESVSLQAASEALNLISDPLAFSKNDFSRFFIL